MITIYTPTNEEADRLLANIEKWVSALRKQNVAADIAAYIARDFLAPMRIRPLDGDGVQNHGDLPDGVTNANLGCEWRIIDINKDTI